MDSDTRWGLILRLLLAAVLVALLNLAPRPHALRQALDGARRAALRQAYTTAYSQAALAAELAPRRLDLSLLAARYALQSGQAQQAIDLLEQPYLASRRSPVDLTLLGDAYQQAGDSYMAAAIWERAAALAPSAEVYQRLAEHALAHQDIPTAIDYLSQLLRFNPADASLNYRLGLLYAAVEPETALAYLAQAGELDPSLAENTLELSRKIRTATLFEQPAYTLVAAGRVLATLEEWELAKAAFLRAAELRPDYAEAWAFLGEARQQTARAGASKYTGLAELQRALGLDPASVSANLLMGLYWSRQGEPLKAIGYIRSTLAVEPDNPLLYAELGSALAQSGDLPAAQAAYEQAITLAPDDPLYYRLLADFSLTHRIQVQDIALPAARTALILAPQDARSLDLLGQTMLTLQDYYSAERFLVQAVASDPAYAPAHLHLGMAFVQLGEMGRARQEFDQAAALGSGTWTAAQAQRFITYYYP